MAVFDLYSKRMKRERGEVEDVYTYDEIPTAFRVQVVQILWDSLGTGTGESGSPEVEKAYEFIVDLLCREYGLFSLSDGLVSRHRNFVQEFGNFILEEDSIERVLDAIEVSFRVVDRFTRSWNYLFRQDCNERADSAIKELNQRMAEHAIGFRFEDGKIFRIDSELIHIEVVKPTLILLNETRFAGAQDEFLSAHEHYRLCNYKESLTDALKAIESVMKTICTSRSWEIKATASVSELIEVCFLHGLIPQFWQGHFASLRSMLQSSIPPGRNKMSAHGQGTSVKNVPQYIAGYILHMTAATIVFLAEADKALT